MTCFACSHAWQLFTTAIVAFCSVAVRKLGLCTAYRADFAIQTTHNQVVELVARMVDAVDAMMVRRDAEMTSFAALE